ncbi:hypothetical protein EDB85DRAFT_2163502 [Lactarius pseudohatsudake]|nr:hypothetical protein EDB85DRAFT_2163502 [Lactarius pseudohatsudake]
MARSVIVTLSPSFLAPPTPLTPSPPTVHAFPLAAEPLSPAPSDPTIATCALKQECAASFVPAPRDVPPPFTESSETSKPIPTPPPPVQAFLPTLQFVQADAPATVPTFAPKCAAPLISVARDVLLPSASTLAPRAPVLPTPTPFNAFLTAPELVQPVQPDATTATLDALTDTIATLKRNLEAILNAQKSTESRAPEPEAAQSQAEHCKFCRSGTHIEEECEEADEYILAGMCKRNVFGRLTLPSGAEVPRRIKGKSLHERFEEYHKQFPGQRAAPAYLENLARPRRPALEDAIPAYTPSAMGATSPGTEETAPAMFQAQSQPHSPKRMLCDPRAASDQARTMEASRHLMKSTVRFSDALGAPKSTARAVSGQRKQERDEAAPSARSQMRKSNFAATAASDHREAPFMVSQRRLFAFVPGIRPEAAHAAASTPAPPKECAVYFAQAAAPQLAHDCAPGRAKPSQRPQAPVPVVEARVSTAPSAHAASPSVRAASPNAHAASPNARAASPSAHDTSQVPCSNYKPACVMPSGSVPSSSRAVPPKHPQSAPPRDKPHDIKPSYEQPATRYRATAPRSPSRSSKPPDVVRQACAMPARLSSSDPATFEIHDATSARTPAMYAKTLSNHSTSYKRLQPARRRARVPQCICDDRAICRGSPSHVAMTASEPHLRRLPRRVHTLAMTFHATESVYQSRGDVRGGSGTRTAQAYQEQPHQVASSADPTASAPQLRGGSHVAIEF